MSLQNEFITRVVLPVMGNKRVFASVERTRDHIEGRAVRPERFGPPLLLDRRVDVSVEHRSSWPVYALAPKRGEAKRHVVYFHGGAYINEIVRTHWQFLAGLVQRVPARCVVPIYPLGGALGAEGTVAVATEIASEVIDTVGGEKVVLMGDSAGGGMALAVAQALRDRGVRPARAVLISPWLEVNSDQPAQRAIEDRDAMLAIPGLVEAGRVYAGPLALDDPRVSPICGDMTGLPPLTVFTGTCDLLNPDSHRLVAACAESEVACELIEAEDMPHVYPLLPTPEGRAARRRLVKVLR